MKNLFLLPVIFLLLTAQALSQTSVEGRLACGKFLNYCDTSKLQLNCQTQTYFAMGYISALLWEKYITTTRSKFSPENIKYSLILFCSNNPLKDTHDGAMSIYQEFR